MKSQDELKQAAAAAALSWLMTRRSESPLARAVRMKLEFMVSIMLPRMMREMAEM